MKTTQIGVAVHWTKPGFSVCSEHEGSACKRCVLLPTVLFSDRELVLHTIISVIGLFRRSIIVWGLEEVVDLVEDQGMGDMSWRQA